MGKIISAVLIVGIGVICYFSFSGRPVGGKSDGYKIVKKWELPDPLDEISAMAWIGDGRVVSVQDEDGVFFIYDMQSSQIEKSVEFGSGGDYEGIAAVGNDVFVLRSDGVIFEISAYQNGKPEIKKHVTAVNRMDGINLEGFVADTGNQRLLLAVKERKGNSRGKEIFSFDLNRNKVEDEPLFVIDLSNEIFREVDEKLKERFTPGEIGINPQTGEYYILDGTRPKLLVVDQNGTLKELFMLDPDEFGNPEGLTFSPDGTLYISNEAEDGAAANILQVKLNRKENKN